MELGVEKTVAQRKPIQQRQDAVGAAAKAKPQPLAMQQAPWQFHHTKNCTHPLFRIPYCGIWSSVRTFRSDKSEAKGFGEAEAKPAKQSAVQQAPKADRKWQLEPYDVSEWLQWIGAQQESAKVKAGQFRA